MKERDRSTRETSDQEFAWAEHKESVRLQARIEELTEEVADLLDERAAVRDGLLDWYADKETEELFPEALDRVLREEWGERLAAKSSPWTPLSPDSMPPRDRPLLVTNNITGRLHTGQMSALWLVPSVHEQVPRSEGRSEFYAYTLEGELLRWLTHWRLALPEDA